MFDRKIYFDSVRESLFYGTLDQGQVDGQEAILSTWEKYTDDKDVRWLAYMLATTIHETASTMLPIEEYGRGGSAEYAQIDPETGQGYWGRGFVQLTWRDNYHKSDVEIEKTFNIQIEPCEWDADLQLEEPVRAMLTMYLGMTQGWFRSDSKGKQTLERYFSVTADDPYGAREIINGDKSKIPSWSDGVSIGNLIKGYHGKFLAALEAARIDAPSPPTPEPSETVAIAITTSKGVQVVVTVNGEEV